MTRARVGIEIEEIDTFAALPAQAVRLLAEAGARDLFVSDYWFRTFEAEIAAPERRTFYAVAHRDGNVAVVLPLMQRRLRRAPLTELSAMSNFYTHTFAPAYDPALAGDDAALEDLLQALAAHLRRRYRTCLRVDFRPLDTDGQFYRVAEAALRGAGYRTERFCCFGNWYAEVNGASFAEYLETRPGALRSTIKRKRRKLDRERAVRFVLVTSEDGLPAALDDFERIYALSWKIPERFPRFVRRIATELARRGRLRLGLLYVDGEPAAAQMWFLNDGRVGVFKLAYDPRFRDYSVGTIITAQLIEHFLDVDRVRVVDFLSGDDPYKKDWASERGERWGVEGVDPSSPVGSAFMLARAVRRRLRR